MAARLLGLLALILCLGSRNRLLEVPALCRQWL